MATRDDETIELESQPLNAEKKAEIFTSTKSDQKKEKICPVRIGLTKEELMKYAQDPFWCRLRQTLFYLYWLLWLAMFLGAFLIIRYVPSCPATSRLKWYQKEATVQVELAKLFNNKVSKLSDPQSIDSYMKVFQAKTLLLPSLFNSDFMNHTVHHTLLNDRLGSVDELKKAILYLKENHEASAIMDFDVAVTSREHFWFKMFLAQDEKYADYYLIADSDYNDYINYETESLNNGKGKLITKSGKPVLNLLNANVSAEFREIFKYWSKLNIKGYRLLGAPYLLIDPEDTRKRVLKSVELNQRLIKEWTKELRYSVSDGVFILQLDDQDADSSLNYFGNQSDPIADIVVNKFISRLNIQNSTGDIRNGLQEYINSLTRWNDELSNIGPWTGWLIEDSNKIDQQSKEDLMICFSNILGYLLPRGTPLTRVSSHTLHIGISSLFMKVLREEMNDIQKYGTFDNARIFSKLSDLRKSYADPIMLGTTEFVDAKLNGQVNDDVFTMIRSNGKQGIIVIANLKNGSKNVTLDVDFGRYPRTAEVAASCKVKEGYLIGTKLNLDQKINLKINETLVAKFDSTY